MEIIKWNKIEEKNIIILDCINDTLKKGKGIIVFEPRLKNVNYICNFLEKNINEPISVYHKKLKKTELWNVWKRAIEGKIKIIVSTRHGVFLPLKNLGTIIFDDEEDRDYESCDQKPYFDARSIAKLRSRYADIKILGLSQAPRVEDFIEAQNQKKFKNLSLNKNHINIKTISLNGIYNFMSHGLINSMNNALQNQKKVILFINRKGEATSINCRDCGFVWRCGKCEIPLRVIKKSEIISLRCNNCGAIGELPLLCPKCKGANIYFRGINTGRIEKEIKKLFPEKKIIKIEKMEMPFDAPQIDNADIIIGTEYLYKNYLYPECNIKNIGLVVLPAVDTFFTRPDIKTDEQGYSWIIKFMNLSVQENAEMIIQTFSLENPILNMALKNSLDFYKKEDELRKKFAYVNHCHTPK